MDDNNRTGFGITGEYQLVRVNQSVVKEEPAEKAKPEMSEEDLLNAVYDKYYSHWSEEDMLEAIEERRQYRERCTFYKEVLEYMENIREVRDSTSVVGPLYCTGL